MILKSKQQNGFGLLIALLIVGLTAGILTTFIASQNGKTIDNEAEIAGWEGAEIARAARIHGRNEIRDRANLVTILSIPAAGFGGTGPELVDPDDLIFDGLLPPGFARNDGTNFFNALGQTVSIYLANHPIDGDPTDPATVPATYVLFSDNANTNPPTTQLRIQDIVSAIREQNVSVSAPLVGTTGTCNGDQTVALWDTGCLSLNDYDLLVDGDGTNNDPLPAGTFIIPTWRSANFDTRAMMRFPQPEQIGVQTMLTDLTMAELQDCDADNDGTLDQNFIQIPTDTGSIDSALCSALSDDNTIGFEVDNRRSILGVQNITDSVGLYINSQAAQDVSIDSFGALIPIAADETNALDVGGAFNGQGNGFTYGTNVDVTAGLVADKNILVTSNVGTNLATANVAVLNANNATATTLNVLNRPPTGSGFSVGVSNATENISLLQSNGNFVTQNLDKNGGAPVSIVTVANEASFNAGLNPASMDVDAGSILNPASPMANQYSFVTGVLQASDLSANQANISNSISSNGTAFVNNTINVSNSSTAIDAECVGDCPKRERFDECTNLQDNGLFPSFGYVTMQDCLDDA